MPTRRMLCASGGSPTLGDCAAAGAAIAMASADVRQAKRASNFVTAILHSSCFRYAEPHVAGGWPHGEIIALARPAGKAPPPQLFDHVACVDENRPLPNARRCPSGSRMRFAW